VDELAECESVCRPGCSGAWGVCFRFGLARSVCGLASTADIARSLGLARTSEPRRGNDTPRPLLSGLLCRHTASKDKESTSYWAARAGQANVAGMHLSELCNWDEDIHTATDCQPSGEDNQDNGPHWQPSAEDVSAFMDARISALKAGLRLTPDQEKNWPAFESAVRDMAKVRADRWAMRQSEQPPANPVERLERRADALGKVAAGLKKLADAEGPLYKSIETSL
jgi:LTXXQ motif family protein